MDASFSGNTRVLKTSVVVDTPRFLSSQSSKPTPRHGVTVAARTFHTSTKKPTWQNTRRYPPRRFTFQRAPPTAGLLFNVSSDKPFWERHISDMVTQPTPPILSANIIRASWQCMGFAPLRGCVRFHQPPVADATRAGDRNAGLQQALDGRQWQGFAAAALADSQRFPVDVWLNSSTMSIMTMRCR